MLRAIVFDFDGVIANSEPLHFAAFRDVLSGEGVTLTKEDYYSFYLGYDDVGVFRTVATDRGKKWPADALAAMTAKKAERLETLERGGSVLFPGAVAIIREAAAAMPIAIASGARGEEIRRVLEREELGKYFTAVVAAEDTPSSKPAPDPYLRAMHLLDAAAGGALNGRECVAIEDSRWGLESARAAGMRTVGVTHSYSADELTPSADLVISSLDGLDLRALADLCR